MVGEYKRPIKTLELPSGKKVELITYYSGWEQEEIQKTMAGEQTVKGAKLSDPNYFSEMEIPVKKLVEASRLMKMLAIQKLIDESGVEYQPSEEIIKVFFNSEDEATIMKELAEMSKKKLTKEA